MAENFLTRVFDRLFDREISRRASLAIRAIDDGTDRLISKETYPRDRYDYDRDEVLRDALEAWRVNPLARRVVELCTQYVVGSGLGVECKHEATNKFLQAFWAHRLNRLPTRVFEWCDELSRSGEIFIVLSTDASGMSYVRALPAADILQIETEAHDIEQELWIWEKPYGDGQDQPGPDGLLSGRRWQAYQEGQDGRGEAGLFAPVVLHYAVNRPVGAKHGESDLAPILRWLARYAAWLEDRARLNRFRNAFMYVVKAKFVSKEERLSRQAELNLNPPNPGSILVVDETETWEVMSPKLSSFESAEDGLALKKMVCAGSGNPLHFLAEPESATRTTAEAAGGPTFRHYQQRQLYFLWMIEDLCRVALRRRQAFDRRVKPDEKIQTTGTDISARDNVALAQSASMVVEAFAALRDRNVIDDAELLRLAYRFAGEVVDVEEMLKRGKAAPKIEQKPVDISGDDIAPNDDVS
jgi:hypothetical protein